MALLPLISAGAGILSSILGSNAADDQLKMQREQLKFQKEQAKAQLELAKEAARMGKATQVDAAGNLTAYDEATNTWKTILSADQKALLDANEIESLTALTRDASLSRGERETAARTRVGAGETADTLKSQIDQQLSGRGGYNTGDIESSLRLSRERAVSQGFDDVSNTLSTQAMRSGSRNLDQIASALARARSQAIAQQLGDPRNEAIVQAEQLNQGKLGQNANLYNLFNSTASNPGAVAPNTNTNVDMSSLGQARTAAANGLGQQGSLTNSAASIMNNAKLPEINNTWGNLLGGISNLAGSPAGTDIASLIGGLFKKQPAGVSQAIAFGDGVY